MSSSEYYSSESEFDEEWDEDLENVQFQQRWDEEAHDLMDTMREYDIGYSPTRGYADGFVQKNWDFPKVTLNDVLKPQRPGHPGLHITASRLGEFIEVAHAYAKHYRPNWISNKYICGIAAEMIRHHYGIQVL